ncbi:MAG: SAM-dependent methyltransferase [Polynucleobacter sp.]|nr:SAM-dependent methyltransferase [Polynucleobacter sp.]
MEILTNTEALAHCRQLSNLIDSEVKKSFGWLPFSHYMELALYAPNLGYYTAGSIKFGSQGDFITAPEISPWFGAAVTQTLIPVLSYFSNQSLPSQILEFGAGSGALAQSILLTLKRQNQILTTYSILEVSPDLQAIQKKRLQAFVQEHHILTSIEWLVELPKNFSGVVLANEVLDAMPVDLIIKRADGWHYLGITVNPNPRSPSFSDHWIYCDGPLVAGEDLPTYLQSSQVELALGYTTEIHSRAKAWTQTLAEQLRQGIFLTFDYGFPAKEYYHPQRNKGTLIAHHRHHSIDDVFYLPGLCDITAHIEWTSMNQVAQTAGLNLIGYSSQGAYLLNAGIGQLLLDQLDPHDAKNYLPQANGVQKLLSEAEMGELFKAVAWYKNSSNDPAFEEVAASLPGFTGKLRLLEA